MRISSARSRLVSVRPSAAIIARTVHEVDCSQMTGDLFSHSAESRLERVAPLAQRLRPGTIDEFVGQRDVVGEGSALRRAIAKDSVPSMIFYGPPGSGKTTLARIVAHPNEGQFEKSPQGPSAFPTAPG